MWASNDQGGGPSRGKAPISVLYVEDDETIRDVTAMILQDEGFSVDSVLTAEDAVERMKARSYDVVLTDHNLPGNSGAWLLESTTQNGLLGGTSGLVLTACTGRIEVGPQFPVLRKPLEFSDLIAAVHEAASRSRSAPTTRFSLYVSTSPASVRARRNLGSVLLQRGLDDQDICVHVVEPGASWKDADADHVLEVPVLVRHGHRRGRIVGDLSDHDTLAGFLTQGA